MTAREAAGAGEVGGSPEDSGGPTSGRDAPLLGRERELAELEAALAEAFEGKAQFCLLAGESGIGKTCLATAVGKDAARAGAVVRWGRSWEGGGAPSFWPWVQVIRGLSRTPDLERLRAQLGPGAPWIAQLVSELTGLLPDLEAPSSLEGEQARFALFDAVATFLQNVAEEQPLALVFDDIHAADPPSLLMLEFMARSIRDAPIFLLATYQEAAAHVRPEVDEIVGELAREARRISLRRLGREEIASLIDFHAEGAVPPQMAQALHETTEGNPFFVNEVVRLLAVEGQLELSAGAVRARFPLPETVRDAIRRRFQPLGTDAIDTLATAAVVGRYFRLRTLEHVTGAKRDELIETIGRAIELGLVDNLSGDPGLFRFEHGLMRETLYEDLPPARRMRAHAAVGEALESVYGTSVEPHLAELANHFLEAAPSGYAAKAVEYAERAGAHAMKLLAYEQATHWFEGALGALELAGSDEERRAELLLDLGRAQVRAGAAVARQTLFAAADAARTLDRPDLLAEAALGFRAFVRTPGVTDEEVIALVEDALERLDPSDSELRARLVVRLAVQLYSRLDATDRREELAREAEAMARRLGDPATLAYVLVNAQLVTWRHDTRDQALKWSQEVLSLAERVGDTELAIITRNRLADLLLEVNDLAGAAVQIEALDRLARENPEPRAHAYVALQRARRATIAGSYAEAERLIAEAEVLGNRARDASIGAIAAAQRWSLSWSKGRVRDLEVPIRDFAAATPGYPVWRVALALVHCDLGQEAQARGEFERLAADGFPVPHNDAWLLTLSLLAEVCAHLGDRERAEVLYRQLEPFAGRNILTLHGAFAGQVSRYLALLATVGGRWEEATAHLADANAAGAEIGARPVAAMLLLDEAGMLAARGGEGDADRAAELAAQAASLARELGADGLVERADGLLEELGAPGAQTAAVEPAAGPAAASLRREGDVWVFDYAGRAVRVRDSKGLRYLARLLESPGVEVHALELVGAGEGTGADVAGAAQAGLSVRSGGDDSAGPLLDAEAKAAYRERLEELREEVEEAESFNDPERASRAREEMDFVARELAGAVGLGGRDRKSASNAERARVNVTRAIRGVLKRVADFDADLGRELESTVRTGTFCAYEPDPRRPVSWTIEEG